MLVSCSQVNDMMIKINKLFHKLAVAHYGTYNAILVIGHSCCFFHFLGNRASSMLFVIWNMNSRDWLWLSVLCTTDGCVCMCERSFAHHYILWGFEPSKSFGLCKIPLLQRKTDRKCLCRWRRFLQGDRTLFLFCNVILWWALDFLSGTHETSFWIQRAISGWFIASKQSAQTEECIMVTTFFWSHVCSYPSCSFAEYTGE